MPCFEAFSFCAAISFEKGLRFTGPAAHLLTRVQHFRHFSEHHVLHASGNCEAAALCSWLSLVRQGLGGWPSR
ncbi:unnamed protein product [Polarella glacialis]|uniref:Uncharacterized protein n=1 Tax=Polarella glacialis TaxID=89957 RepID=A0A813GMZ9_POLGL|nr:unnamed protein product [Polarella glacialis]